MGGDRLDLLARIQELEEENKKLERALDKACEELYETTLFIKSLNATLGFKKDKYTKDDWKEVFMKDDE